jgi:hypothetical protein
LNGRDCWIQVHRMCGLVAVAFGTVVATGATCWKQRTGRTT